VSATTFVGLILKADPKNQGVLLEFTFEWIQKSAWLLILVFGMVTLATKYLSSLIGAPWVWATVQKVLNEVRKDAFNRQPEDPIHAHRITLFKRVAWRWRVRPTRGSWWRPWGTGHWPWSGWLVPISRSGHTTQRSEAVFLAPDDADKCEGIAGQVWARDQTIILENLPDLNIGCPTDQNITDYATRAWLPESWVRRRLNEGKPFARSLCGIPVEVNGRLWGVLVLDSRNPDGINRRGHSWSANERMVRILLAELLRLRA
jgi:hypothetical protein